MFCPYCGAKNPERASFCVACGAPLPEVTGTGGGPAARDAASPAPAEPPATPKVLSAPNATRAAAGASDGRARSSGPLVIVCVAVLILLFAAVGIYLLGSGGGAQGSSAASWTPASYMDAAIYDEPVSDIIATLEDESFTFYHLNVEDSTVYVFMRTLSAAGAFPHIAPGESTYVMLQLNLPEGVDPSLVQSPEDIPDSSELAAARIYATTELSEDELIPTSREIIDGMGFDNPQNVLASNEELYDEYVNEYGVPDNASTALMDDAQNDEVMMGTSSDEFFPQRTGAGGWSLTCTATGGSDGSQIVLTYMPLY